MGTDFQTVDRSLCVSRFEQTGLKPARTRSAPLRGHRYPCRTVRDRGGNGSEALPQSILPARGIASLMHECVHDDLASILNRIEDYVGESRQPQPAASVSRWVSHAGIRSQFFEHGFDRSHKSRSVQRTYFRVEGRGLAEIRLGREREDYFFHPYSRRTSSMTARAGAVGMAPDR